VRLLLDAHVSGRAVARALRERGHDVLAADKERELDGWEDERLLSLAASEGRILVTFNVRDFARLAAEWVAGGTRHGGCLLVVGSDHSEFGLTLRVIDAALKAHPRQDEWHDRTAWGTRARA
jgi:nucleoside-diphosphate-sugar epimerase